MILLIRNRRHIFQSMLLAVLALSVALPANALVGQHEDDAQLLALEQEIARHEAAFSDIVPNTERTIRWYARKQVSQYAIVYLHGFSASRQEISPVTELLAEQLQANVYYARLTGHGRSDDAMAEAKVEAWLDDVQQAYNIGRQIGEKVILISTSTGGTLATWLVAQDFADKVFANIMLSPNFGVNNWSAGIVRWPWGLRLAIWANGSEYRSFTPSSNLHRQYWTERYPMRAVVPMIKLVDMVNKLDKSNIKIPQVMIFSPADKVIDVDEITRTSEEFSLAKVQLIPFTQSHDRVQHVLAGDACSPQSNQALLDLLYTTIVTLQNESSK